MYISEFWCGLEFRNWSTVLNPFYFVERFYTPLRNKYKIAYHSAKKFSSKSHTPNFPLKTFLTLPNCSPLRYPELQMTDPLQSKNTCVYHLCNTYVKYRRAVPSLYTAYGSGLETPWNRSVQNRSFHIIHV